MRGEGQGRAEVVQMRQSHALRNIVMNTELRVRWPPAVPVKAIFTTRADFSKVWQHLRAEEFWLSWSREDTALSGPERHSFKLKGIFAA